MTIHSGGGGLESSTLPDEEFTERGQPVSFDDDVDVFMSEDEALAEPERRGQNEPGGAAHDGDPDFADIADPSIRDRFIRERQTRMDVERRAQSEREEADGALLGAQKQMVRAQLDSFKLALDGVDVRIRTTREALKMAKTDGDTSAEVDLQEQLGELQTVRGGIQNNLSRLPSEADLDTEFRAYVARRRPASGSGRGDDGVRPLNDRASRWQSQNSWMTDPARAAEKAALLAIDKQLVGEGRDPNTDDYFVELSRRAAKTLPNLGVRDLSGRALGGAQSPAPRSSAPPVAGARSALPPSPSQLRRGPNGKPQLELNGDDRKMLRSLGVDLADKKTVQRYAKEKYQRLRSEGMGR